MALILPKSIDSIQFSARVQAPYPIIPDHELPAGILQVPVNVTLDYARDCPTKPTVTERQRVSPLLRSGAGASTGVENGFMAKGCFDGSRRWSRS